MSRKAKLKWHCRRGMRELDLLLEEFFESRYDALSPLDREGFERLLDCRNEDLMTWLVEGGTPQDDQLASIVGQIRDCSDSGRAKPGIS